MLEDLLSHSAGSRMHLSRERVHLIFIEKALGRYEHLLGELTQRLGPLNELPVRVEVRRGEAGQKTPQVLDELGAWGHPVLSIFDSWGNVSVPLSLIERIARNNSSEVITTFGPNWFSRRENLNAEHLDVVFGGREHWEPAGRESQPEERWRAWLGTYRDAMQRAGFPYRLQFQVVPRTGQPLYLVYGTGHPKGVEAMKEAMWAVDGNDGMSFCDPRTRDAIGQGQLSLWSGAGSSSPELLDLITQRLEEGAATVNELRTWLLCETARWRPQDAGRAVRELRDAGLATVEPKGRIIKASVVRLQ